MSATVAPSRAATRTSRSRAVSGDAPSASVSAASAGIDDPLAGGHPAHGVGQLLGRRVLDDEAAGARLHGPPQVAGPAERGEDDHAAVGHLLASTAAAARPSMPGISMSSRATSGWCVRGRDHLVAPADLGHHLEVVLEFEQGGEGRADQGLVVGQRGAGSSRDGLRRGETRAAATPRPERAGLSTPPAAPTRSRRPDQPAAPMPPAVHAPTPVVDDLDRAADSRTVHDLAWEWRTTLVSPSRTTQPNSSWWRGSTPSTAPGSSAVDAGRPQQLAPGRQFAGQASPPGSWRRRPARRRGPAATVARPRRSPPDRGRVGYGELPRQAGLDRDGGERMAQQVVQVAGDADALVLGGQPGHLGPGLGEGVVAADHPKKPNMASATNGMAKCGPAGRAGPSCQDGTRPGTSTASSGQRQPRRGRAQRRGGRRMQNDRDVDAQHEGVGLRERQVRRRTGRPAPKGAQKRRRRRVPAGRRARRGSTTQNATRIT